MATFRSAAGTVPPFLSVWILASLLLFPARLSAQEAGDDAPFRAWAAGGASWTLTEVGEHGGSLFGAYFAFGLTPGTLLGGAGFRLSESTPASAGSASADRRLDFGYAGIVVERLRRIDAGWTVSGALLVGAGHATVRSAAASLELGADNFGVLEVRAGPVWRRPAPLRISVRAGYRFAFGVQGLPGVTAADLRGFGLTVSVGLANR